MASLFGGGAKVIPEFTGLQVNTSVQVLPIPIIYGAPRINVNLIYYNGFHTAKSKAGGKGILSGGKGSGIDYFATILLSLGEGVIGDTKMIFQNSGLYTPANYPTNGAQFFPGTHDQTAWFVVYGFWPNDARPYVDTAYWAFYNAQLDSSATVPQIDLVVEGILAKTSPLNDSTIPVTTGQYDSSGNPISFIGNLHLGALDADPAQVIYDFLTNARYGATFPADWIDLASLMTSPDGFTPGVGDASVSSFCQAVGLAWSVVINNVEAANSIIDRWTKNLNVAPVWTGSRLKFVPYWDSYASGNPGWSSVNGIPKKYYQPYTTPAATITMDYVLQSTSKDEDPITFRRKDPMEVYNTVRIDIKDRFNFYNDVPAVAMDDNHIELYGPRVDNIGTANEFSLMSYGQVSATMQLRRNIGIVREFTWRMGPLWAWLNPMDLVVIPDPTNYSNTLVVRITSVEDDEDENTVITAEDFLPATATIKAGGGNSAFILPAAPTTPPYQGALNNPPSAAFPPLIFEPTPELATYLGYSTPIFIFGDCGGTSGQFDANWGGCNVWIALDGVNYTNIVQLVGPSTMGYLTAGLAAYAGVNPDTSETLVVSLSESDGTLTSFDGAGAAAGASICVVQDVNGYEILSYTTATLIAPFTYELSGLYRAMFGTLPRAFSAGAQFMFIGTNATYVVGNLPAAYVGQSFYVKPQSFNVFFLAPEDLTDVVAYYFNITGGTAGGTMMLAERGVASDRYLLAGQFAESLSDSMASSETLAGDGAADLTLAETAMASDTASP